MKISRKATVTTSILLAAGLALTGCSSSANPSEGGSGASQESESSSGALTKDNFVERMSAAQLKAGSVHVKMNLGDAIEGDIEADMVISDDPQKVQMQMTMNTGGMDSDIRVVDGKMFMNMGQVTGGKFMDMSAMPGGGGDVGAILNQVNPGAQLDGFREALTDFQVDPKGPEIDGVKTTQLTLTIDTKKMFEAQPQEGVDADALVEALGDTITYDMFVGPDDLPRRIVTPDIAGLGAATQDYSAWGTPVTVTAPGADEIADMSALHG
ncbi:hypothetical protein [Leucobacter komagatae]|uniref:Lipoprotein n=1 Tax=Leucobacter komagatae TaxID=55969 RepID=A0A0D0IKL6_9MICO|nr:hypothetical protein [Leucobacter komagatae]KIP51642.1 hypothetical protein SD72_14200 [Leucobacter komagatae]